LQYDAELRFSNLSLTKSYSALIALTGQPLSQAPQSTHFEASTAYLSPSAAIASTGHAPTHDPHPTQTSLSIFLAIFFSSLFIFA
jgi:hypothetical protein